MNRSVRSAAVGEDDVLIEVAGVRTLRAILDVPEEQATGIRTGQRVTIPLDGAAKIREGRVMRVGASVDPRTRTVRVRVDLPNPDRVLRAGAFIPATSEVSSPRAALLVPRDAVQRAQEHDVVFVRTAPGQYDPVEVQVGARTRDLAVTLLVMPVPFTALRARSDAERGDDGDGSGSALDLDGRPAGDVHATRAVAMRREST